jgi:hypothetical protein
MLVGDEADEDVDEAEDMESDVDVEDEVEPVTDLFRVLLSR